MLDKESFRTGLGRNKNLVTQLTEFQKNPKSLVFVGLAESYRQEGMLNQAIEVLDEGLDFHPQLASALILKARCLFELKRFANAMQICQAVIADNPQNIKAHKLQSEVYLRLGQRKSAIRALTQVVSLFPQDIEAVKALEELENLEYGTKVAPELLSRASTDMAPQELGKIEEFHVGSFSESLASIGAFTTPDAKPVAADVEVSATKVPVVQIENVENEAEDFSEEPTFATRTIAELYLRQGLTQKAKGVLRKILKDNPANEWARETLQDLGSDGIVAAPQKMTPSPLSKREKKAKVLEQLLSRVRLMKQAGA